MGYSIKDKIASLLGEVSSLSLINAIGQTGDINFIPKAGESDIDIFVFGQEIPSYEQRKVIYDKNSDLYEECSMNVCEGGVWGTGDVFIIDGVETMLMYFTIDETLQYVSDVLEGKRLDSVEGFYPVGRCATLKNINIIYDEDKFLSSLKEELSIYPQSLAKQMAEFHMSRVNDEEDFNRALLRKDVIFYHQVLEASIDHYLQALYAVNKTYYPSRKRTKQYIDSFEMKPVDCYKRLLEVIKFGADPEQLEKSYNEWCNLVKDLKNITNI
ncbi:DUF4037 domain-containing protein [Inconstantimicrobium mannanitabidum]|uniref:Uncharacterized protein n=1 Tax=Inconstantimicrobium mannanitabidum TaxID=1604901 RepID=A0ACB5RGL8_9CLOT|nr:DUF4037 domain-containing protein [Clostridium sp. TW13]GKX68232.1 hypothetical protein rsdtw13_34900 [Clostridium sp. TW13]